MLSHIYVTKPMHNTSFEIKQRFQKQFKYSSTLWKHGWGIWIKCCTYAKAHIIQCVSVQTFNVKIQMQILCINWWKIWGFQINLKCVALESPTHRESWTCCQTWSNFSMATHCSQPKINIDWRPSLGTGKKNVQFGNKFEVVAKPQTKKIQ